MLRHKDKSKDSVSGKTRSVELKFIKIFSINLCPITRTVWSSTLKEEVDSLRLLERITLFIIVGGDAYQVGHSHKRFLNSFL